MSTTITPAQPVPGPAPDLDRYLLPIDDYRAYRRDGFLIVRGLVPPRDIDAMRQHSEDLMQGNLPEQQDLPEIDAEESARLRAERMRRQGEAKTNRRLFRPPAHLSPQEKAEHFLRLHMLHRQLAFHEQCMLHPRVLDVVEVLVGPDVTALQTMLFLKPPSSQGQGWHQDSFYIPTQPDTLMGAWIAIDDADEYNGAMWFAKGSGHEPVYPPCPEMKYGFGDKLVRDIRYVRGVSDPDDANNSLTAVADRYDQVLGSVRAGDVVFFNGHVLHRSKANVTTDRFRRSFVTHYCNARSFTAWARDTENPNGFNPATGSTNGSHILARGDTHLNFAQPRFGTPCAALLPPEQRRVDTERVVRRIAAMDNGLMGCSITDLDSLDHDHHDDNGRKKDSDSGGY